MKRFISLTLACVLMMSMAACGAAFPAQAEDTEEITVNKTAAAETTVAETTAAETMSETEPTAEDNLFLKVSSIHFSLVGESDDIYLGLAPREMVTWESEDPGIVSVENGVLTANGVGTTTIRATYKDCQVSCSAGCLAQTQEELEQLDPEILSAPKRLPPEVDLDEPCTYFDDSVMMGDSLTYLLWQYESVNDYLGEMSFVSRHGISLYGVVERFKNMYYQGQEMYIEDIIASVEAQRVYILLGCLDYQVPVHTKNLMNNWEALSRKIEEKAPDKEIVIVSNIPCFQETTQPAKYNEDVEEAAPKIRKFASDKGYGYLDLGYYIQDHLGRMPRIYSKDLYHINDDGNRVWMKLLRFYAQFEQAGGSLA